MKLFQKTERPRDRETERQRDRETERQRDRETERQRDRENVLYDNYWGRLGPNIFKKFTAVI
jgi:hypothetical protein